MIAIMKCKDIIKKVVVPLIEPYLRFTNRQPRVLFWHGVGINPSHEVEAEVIDVQNFLKQLDYLQKHFDIVSMTEFEKRYKSKTFNNREVVLTFDDGYANNLSVLAPIMHERKLPYTVFISTFNIDTGLFFPTSIARIAILGSEVGSLELSCISKKYIFNNHNDRIVAAKEISTLLKTLPLDSVKELVKDLISNFSESSWCYLQEKYSLVRPMSWEEVRRLKDMGAEIGSHCIDHVCCHSNQKLSELEKQITDSRNIIEQKLGEECRYFAYPNGDNTIESNLITDNVYKLGFTTNKKERITSYNGISSIPRIGIPYNFETFLFVLNKNPY